jgi:hypothetical protein
MAKQNPPPAEASSSIDPAAAEKAFLGLKSSLLALNADYLTAVNVDVQRAAITACAVGRWIKQPEVRARFASLPAKEFKVAQVDDLESVALAAWHITIELLTAGSGSSEAMLPISLVEAATAVKQRMLALLEYYLSDHPLDSKEVASIKAGTGYADLASDLLRLAKLYHKHAAAVALDTKHYVATDAHDARKHGMAIVKLLGDARNVDEKAWTDLLARSWTLLNTTYDEVSAAGEWLLRHEGGAERFPSLYVSGRAGGRPKKKAAAAAEPVANEPKKPE